MHISNATPTRVGDHQVEFGIARSSWDDQVGLLILAGKAPKRCCQLAVQCCSVSTLPFRLGIKGLGGDTVRLLVSRRRHWETPCILEGTPGGDTGRMREDFVH